jgi:hypothetical protein
MIKDYTKKDPITGVFFILYRITLFERLLLGLHVDLAQRQK